MKPEEKQEIIQTVAEAFESLILPHIDELKSDIAKLKTDVTDLKAGQQRLEEGQETIGKRQEQEQTMLDSLDRDVEAFKKQYPLAA